MAAVIPTKLCSPPSLLYSLHRSRDPKITLPAFAPVVNSGSRWLTETQNVFRQTVTRAFGTAGDFPTIFSFSTTLFESLLRRADRLQLSWCKMRNENVQKCGFLRNYWLFFRNNDNKKYIQILSHIKQGEGNGHPARPRHFLFLSLDIKFNINIGCRQN